MFQGYGNQYALPTLLIFRKVTLQLYQKLMSNELEIHLRVCLHLRRRWPLGGEDVEIVNDGKWAAAFLHRGANIVWLCSHTQPRVSHTLRDDQMLIKQSR